MPFFLGYRYKLLCNLSTTKSETLMFFTFSYLFQLKMFFTNKTYKKNLYLRKTTKLTFCFPKLGHVFSHFSDDVKSAYSAFITQRDRGFPCQFQIFFIALTSKGQDVLLILKSVIYQLIIDVDSTSCVGWDVILGSDH